MRNLKRVLSLALACAALAAMMAFGAGAAYADVDSQDNLEAIEVMQAVGAMTGDEKGNFNPDKLVTRNEMAAVMTRLLGLDPNNYSTVALPFTDVPAWARNFVAACYSNGIISGTSATTYGGDSDVTAAQAALMMMKALGYFQYKSDFNNDWQLAAIRQASKIDLFKGLTSNATTALNRNNVAQLALNTLKADMVEASGTPGTDIITTDGTVINVGNTVKYDPKPATSYNYNYAAAGTHSRTYQQLCESLYGNDLRMNDNNRDNFGRPANRWTYKAREIGAYAKQATVTYTDVVKSSALYSDLGLSANKTASYTVDGQTTGTFLVAKSNSTKTETIPGVGPGTRVEVFYDSDTDKVDLIAINTYVGQVSNVYPDAAKPYITISGLTGVSGDFEATGYKVDDVVVYTYDGTAIQSVALAKKVGGAEVTAYATDKLTAGGQSYTRNVNNLDEGSISLNSSYDLYLDANGFLVYTKLFEGSSNYAYVMEATRQSVSGISDDTWTVKMAFADGRVATVKTDYDQQASPKNRWVTYTEKKGVYSLYLKATSQGAGSTLVEHGKSAMTLNGGTYFGNDSTVFLIRENGTNNYRVYTGIKNVPTVAASGSAFSPVDVAVTYGAGNVARYVYIDAAAANITDSAKGVIYVISGSRSVRTTDDRGEYYSYEALVDGEVTTILVSTNFSGSGFDKGVLSADAKLGSLNYSGKGLVTGAAAYSAASGEQQIAGVGTTRYQDGTIGLNVTGLGQVRYTAASDVAVYTIRDNKFTKSSFTAVGTDSDDTFYALLKDGQVKALFITKVDVATPALSANISGNVITVTVSNNASAGNMVLSCSVTGGASAAINDTIEKSGTGTITLTGAGTSGYVTVRVTNTVPNVGSAYAEYVVAYSLP